MKKGDVIENLEITGYGGEGKAIGRIDNFVVFVENAVPGDFADVQLYHKKKNFGEAKVVRLVKPSPDRTVPFCEHFGVCGGCKWQHLSYDKQLYFKQQLVADSFERIGHLEFPEITPIRPSKDTTFYRNKLEFTFSNRAWLTKNDFLEMKAELPALGFHVPQRFDKVLDINTCYLQDEISNSIRKEIRQYCIQNNLTFFDLKEQHGMMRNLIIRNSSTGEWMVIVVFHVIEVALRNNLLEHIKDKFPFINSLQYIINTKKNDTIFDLPVELFSGRDYILEKMENLTFRISAKSFYQTNSNQAFELYKIVREFAGLTGKEKVYDLYTGTGTIANFVSSLSSEVYGIDYIEDAIKDAGQNALDNKLTNLSFFAGDIKDVLNEDFINKTGKPDVIITDPPRAGMHSDVILSILKASPEKIVYISCNPATQARDLQLMMEQYRIERIQPVDMFPHTSHVENVVLLVKR